MQPIDFTPEALPVRCGGPARAFGLRHFAISGTPVPMAQIATTLDASDPNADPKEVLNNVKFAAARAVSVEAPGGHEPPMTRSMRR